MTGQEALDLLMGRITRTSSSIRATALLEMVRWLDRLERTALSFKPWFMFTDDTASLDTVANTETVALPASFRAWEEEGELLYIQNPATATPDVWTKLTRKTYAYLKEEYVDSSYAIPTKFDVLGETIYLRPIPDAAYNLRALMYVAQSAPADDAVETSWLKWAPDLLIAGAAYQVATKHLRDTELSAALAGEIQELKVELYRMHEARATAGHNDSMGDD